MRTERQVTVTADDGSDIAVTLIERRAADKTATNVRTLFGHADEVAYGDEHDVVVNGVVLGVISHRVTEVAVLSTPRNESGDIVEMNVALTDELCERWNAEPVDFSLGVSRGLVSEFYATRMLLTKYGRVS